MGEKQVVNEGKSIPRPEVPKVAHPPQVALPQMDKKKVWSQELSGESIPMPEVLKVAPPPKVVPRLGASSSQAVAPQKSEQKSEQQSSPEPAKR